MSTHTIGSILLWSQVLGFFAFCVVMPFRFVLRTGRFGRGVVYFWAAGAGFSFCSVMLGQYLYTHIDKSLADSCFEGPQFLVLALMGWLSPVMLFAGIAYLLFCLRKRLAKKQASIDHEAAA